MSSALTQLNACTAGRPGTEASYYHVKASYMLCTCQQITCMGPQSGMSQHEGKYRNVLAMHVILLTYIALQNFK